MLEKRKGTRIVLDTDYVSETDGEGGVFLGIEGDYVRVLLDKWQSVMLFKPHEVLKVN